MSESIPQNPGAPKASPSALTAESSDSLASAPATGQPTMTRFHLMALCATLHGASFFFPWIGSFFGRPSGADFAKAGGSASLLWIWPALSGVTLWLAATGKPYKLVALLAGAAPFVVLMDAYTHFQSLEFTHNITGGGWFALGCGAVLLMFPSR